MLFKYGLPEPLDRHGHQHLILEQVDDDEALLAQSYVGLSKVALALLVLGFVFN